MTWSIIARDTRDGRNRRSPSRPSSSRSAAASLICAPASVRLATQALTNPLYGRRGLALLGAGVPAEDVVRMLTALTRGKLPPASCDGCEGGSPRIPEAIASIGPATRRPRVLLCRKHARGTACRRRYVGSPSSKTVALPMARRMIEAMKAGEAAGGDKRGKQSACLGDRLDRGIFRSRSAGRRSSRSARRARAARGGEPRTLGALPEIPAAQARSRWRARSRCDQCRY